MAGFVLTWGCRRTRPTSPNKIYGELDSPAPSDVEFDELSSPEVPEDWDEVDPVDEDPVDEDGDVDSELVLDPDDPPLVEPAAEPVCLLPVPAAGGVPMGVSNRSGRPN